MKSERRQGQKNAGTGSIAAAVVMFAVLVCSGSLLVCCSPRVIQPAVIKDSVRIRICERVIHDTAYFEMPVIRQVNVTRDTSSHLENDYASSDASIVDGNLRHSLESKPQKILVPVEVVVHDTTVVEKQAQTIIQEVPAQISKWQAFQMILGRIMGIILIICAVYAALKLKSKMFP